jgi:hypothetical protein
MYYKLSNRFYINQLVLLIFLTTFLIQANAQNSTFTRPVVTEKYDDYQKQVAKDLAKKFDSKIKILFQLYLLPHQY